HAPRTGSNTNIQGHPLHHAPRTGSNTNIQGWASPSGNALSDGARWAVLTLQLRFSHGQRAAGGGVFVQRVCVFLADLARAIKNAAKAIRCRIKPPCLACPVRSRNMEPRITYGGCCGQSE